MGGRGMGGNLYSADMKLQHVRPCRLSLILLLFFVFFLQGGEGGGVTYVQQSACLAVTKPAQHQLEVEQGGSFFVCFFFSMVTDRKTRAEITRGDLAAAALLD